MSLTTRTCYAAAVGILAICLLTACDSTPGHAQTTPTWATTPPPVTLTISSTPSQTIKGFGAFSSILDPTPQFVTLADKPNTSRMLYKDLGLDVFRFPIEPQMGRPDGTLDLGLLKTLKSEIRNARAYGISKYILSTWSPPASMKMPEQTVNGKSASGGTETLNPAAETAFVTYYADVLSALSRSDSATGPGVALPVGISLQNESNFTAPWYSCNYSLNADTRAGYRHVVKGMRAALNKRGMTRVQILAVETSDYAASADTLGAGFCELGKDPALNAAIGGFAVHSYDQVYLKAFRTALQTYPRDVWHTEWSAAVPPESVGETWPVALTSVRHMGSDLVDGGVNYWFFWLGASNTSAPTPETLLYNVVGDSDIKKMPMYGILQTICRMVQPGWTLRRMASTDPAVVCSNDAAIAARADANPLGVDAFAFQSPDNAHNVVVICNGSHSWYYETPYIAHDQTFSLRGLKGTQATVYTGTAAQDMKSTAHLAIDGGAATVRVPVSSVVVVTSSPAN